MSDDVDWVSLSPLGGFSTGEQNAVTVSVNISGMTAGSYNATITISACCPNPTNSPQHVPVSLNISAGLVESANTEAAYVRIAVQAYIADGGSSIAGVMGSTAGPSRNCTGFTPNTHGKTPMDYFDGELRAEYSINTTALCIITAADPSGPGNWGDSIEWDYAICEWKNA